MPMPLGTLGAMHLARIIHKPTPSLWVICEETRVQQAVTITKNAAEASDTALGYGATRLVSHPQRAGRSDVTPEPHFSGLRNPRFEADGPQRQGPIVNNAASDGLHLA
jgi:hypothetical protein